MVVDIDVGRYVAFGALGGCDHFAFVACVDHYSLGDQRSCLPQLRAVCLAVAYHPIDGLYCYAILDVLAGVYVPGAEAA